MEFIRPKKPSLSLDMAPLIDVVFQLLIFFMLSSSFLVPAMRLSLPKAVEHDQKVPESLVISVDREGQVFLNTSKTAMTELEAQIESRLIDEPRKAIHIRGDKDMPYQYFIEVMDAARRAGAKQINIMHEGAGGDASEARP